MSKTSHFDYDLTEMPPPSGILFTICDNCLRVVQFHINETSSPLDIKILIEALHSDGVTSSWATCTECGGCLRGMTEEEAQQRADFEESQRAERLDYVRRSK